MYSKATAVLALCSFLGLSGTALAQGTGAPAGREPATAPGGTEGAAAIPNEREAIRSGDAVPAPPGVGVPVAPTPEATEAERRRPSRP